MKSRFTVFAAAALAVGLLAVGCGGDGGGGGGGGQSSSGSVKTGGILRIGSINYIDSFNPLKYIETQSTNAFIMLYPQLVQYSYSKADGFKIEGDWATSWDTSSDGKTWTFHLHPDTKWSDGKPLTADDAAWTINTIVKYADGPTAVAAPSVSARK